MTKFIAGQSVADKATGDHRYHIDAVHADDTCTVLSVLLGSVRVDANRLAPLPAATA